MNNIKSSLRIATLVALFAIALSGILSTSETDDMTRWITTLIISKSLGVASLWAFLRLYLRWSRTDKWISRYHAWNIKGCNQ